MPILPTILRRQIVAKSELFTVEQLDLRFSNGNLRTFEKLINKEKGVSNAVMIVAINAQNQVILIEEYSAGTEDYQLTLPKGLIEKGEDILAAANRELQEEAGFKAHKLKYLTNLSLSPGYMEQFIHVVLAQDLEPSKLAGDEPEPLTVFTHDLADLMGLINNKKFSEARALAALFMAREILLKDK